MKLSQAKYGIAGVCIGIMALFLAFVMFWADPFTVESSIEADLTEKVSSVKETVTSLLTGTEAKKETFKDKVDMNMVVNSIISLLSVLAILLSVFSFIAKEPIRITLSAAALGMAAVVFHFLALYIIAFLGMLFLLAIIASLINA